jgi:hypothetical protein
MLTRGKDVGELRANQTVAVTVLLLLCASSVASAQVLNSGARVISLNATLSDSISVNLSGNSVNFILTPASPTNPGSTSITATTYWNSRPGRDVSLYAYFTTSGNALTDGAGHAITSSNFQISDNGGPYRALTNTVPFGGAGAGLQLFTRKITGLIKKGSNVDRMMFNIDLSTLPQLPAGTYTGILYIQAQVIRT